MKKVVAIVLVLVLALSAFAGCGEKPAEEQVGMTWSNWSGAEKGSVEAFDSMISTWNTTAEVNDQVTQINWPWGDTTTQLALRSQGSEQYDVAQIDIRMLPALAEAGVLADLTPLFGSDYFTANYPAGSIDVGQYNGTQYCVPWTIAPVGMIANPQILAEAGVDFDIVTIADFEKACELVKTNHPDNKDSNKGNDIIPYAVMNKEAGTAAPDFMAWLWTFGAEIFDDEGNVTIDSPEAVKCLEWFQTLSTNGYTQEAMGRNDARTLYKEGRVAFYDDALMSKGSITNDAFGSIEEYAQPMVRPVLKAGDESKALAWGHLLVVINRSEKKEDAKAFIEHLNSKEVSMNYFKSNGMLPAKKDNLADPAVASDYWSKSWTPILDGGRVAETAGLKEAAYNKVIADQLQALLSGTSASDVATAMKKGLENA